MIIPIHFRNQRESPGQANIYSVFQKSVLKEYGFTRALKFCIFLKPALEFRPARPGAREQL